MTLLQGNAAVRELQIIITYLVCQRKILIHKTDHI
jgi:hypothetical protein